MNVKRRDLIRRARTMIENGFDILNRCLEEEQSAMDNYPEGLQESQVYFDMEEAVDALDDATEALEEVLLSLGRIL